MSIDRTDISVLNKIVNLCKNDLNFDREFNWQKRKSQIFFARFVQNTQKHIVKFIIFVYIGVLPKTMHPL